MHHKKKKKKSKKKKKLLSNECPAPGAPHLIAVQSNVDLEDFWLSAGDAEALLSNKLVELGDSEAVQRPV